MKNSLLYCLAAASLVLSFCFERVPDASLTSRALNAPAVAEASLLSGLMTNEPGGPTGPPTSPEAAAARDSLAYGYYAQTLGLNLAHTENKGLLQTVTDWIGTPYRFGASSRRGTDCSGFVTRVFNEVYGIALQRSSRSMFGSVQHVAKTDMQTGDLVFFRHGKGAIYHVGIYLKDGKFAHSACNGGVRVSSLDETYYRRNFYAAGRVPAAARADAATLADAVASAAEAAAPAPQ
ncbi:C40 family peptidase [Hymenobacter caeli]|uniref:Lipoprotein Spr/probable lipoprotein NlpC n=1 Tax=Hymenobacter caeli TaxID=2735894 RepID=A0ABX2FLB2_9BACT|nr:NlpC/P60 family protein [Hymenobacter caeli]NRT17911.1 lipoprotein Spr/probable lipoprotein NlpC [Hymenobacter caeli]